jgi:hypothetical protein
MHKGAEVLRPVTQIASFFQASVFHSQPQRIRDVQGSLVIEVRPGT